MGNCAFGSQQCEPRVVAADNERGPDGSVCAVRWQWQGVYDTQVVTIHLQTHAASVKVQLEQQACSALGKDARRAPEYHGGKATGQLSIADLQHRNEVVVCPSRVLDVDFKQTRSGWLFDGTGGALFFFCFSPLQMAAFFVSFPGFFC